MEEVFGLDILEVVDQVKAQKPDIGIDFISKLQEALSLLLHQTEEDAIFACNDPDALIAIFPDR